ncbi:hypothetical protein ACF07T_16890 [Streptomyces sp. NPDC015184]|uniref:hypothetical protein n=1 Tax=Streptomyces sp. NPDC015184 TaxID=3364946 RepID=UPI0036F5E3A8
MPESMLGLVRQCLEKVPGKGPASAELTARTGIGGTVGPWLPGEVLDRLGRHAARLLDLDLQVRTPGGPVRTDATGGVLPDAEPTALPARRAS